MKIMLKHVFLSKTVGFQVQTRYIPGNLDTNRDATAVLVVLMIAFETANIEV